MFTEGGWSANADFQIRKKNKLGLSSAKLSRVKFGCLEVIFEFISEGNLK